MLPPNPESSRNVRAFSLMELLVVMAVITLLITLVVPAVGNFGRATNLVRGGNMVANLAIQARQTAITKGTLTALVMLGNQGSEADYRAFTVLEYSPWAGWSQIGKWETLPDGIVALGGSFAKESPKTLPFTSGGNGGLKQDNSPMRFRGQPVKNFAARVFLAGGGLQNVAVPAQLELVEGYLTGGKPTFTRPDNDGQPANAYEITLIGATGIARIAHR